MFRQVQLNPKSLKREASSTPRERSPSLSYAEIVEAIDANLYKDRRVPSISQFFVGLLDTFHFPQPTQQMFHVQAI